MLKVNSVSAIILNNANDVLVSERRAKTGYGKLCFPGGKVDIINSSGQREFENPVKAIYREVIEESCMRLYDIKYFIQTNTTLETGYQWVTYYYIARSNDKPYENEPEKQVNWKWIDLSLFDNPKDDFFFPLNDLIIKLNAEGGSFKESVLNSLNENKEQLNEINNLL